jgi:soluble lytic murein transglycosylase-like protein
MGTSFRVPSLGRLRPLRLAPWLLGLLSTVVSLPAMKAGGVAGEAAKLALTEMALPVLNGPEVLRTARAAAWARAAADAAAEGKLADVIRKDPKGFALFAGAPPATEVQAVLGEVPYGEQIAAVAAEHGVDGLLVAAVVEVESTFDPAAGSRRGAVGLMQLLPSTAGLSRSRLLEPGANLDAGTAYLSELITRFEGDLELALAAYNAGPTNVRRYDGVPPFPETERYVEKVLTRYVEHHLLRWQVARGIDLGAILA